MRDDDTGSPATGADLPGDVVTPEWVARHAIRIPRAAGVFKSPTAWVRVGHAGVIVAAGPVDQHVLTWLVERGVLHDGDVDYAIAFVACRDAHRAYRKEKGYKSVLDIQVAGSSLSCEVAARTYSLVRRALGANYCRVVEYACDTVRTADSPANYRPPYRKAFSALARAFHDAMEAVREGAD